ncbi:MAG: hypothetical protein ISS74_11245, partial [Planctomycetes bacterium]|nr:hypothetical protein [Planctomycetota bacterium]
LGYIDSYRSARLPQNLTQAQRDYFGAHTYQRTDKEGSFHTEWTASPRQEPATCRAARNRVVAFPGHHASGRSPRGGLGRPPRGSAERVFTLGTP